MPWQPGWLSAPPALFGTRAGATAGVVNQQPACAAPSSTFEKLLRFLQDRDEQPFGWPQNATQNLRKAAERSSSPAGKGRLPAPLARGCIGSAERYGCYMSKTRDGDAAAMGTVTPGSRGDAVGQSGGAAGAWGFPLWSQSRCGAALAGQGRARKPRTRPGSCSGKIAISHGASCKSTENGPAADAPPLKNP